MTTSEKNPPGSQLKAGQTPQLISANDINFSLKDCPICQCRDCAYPLNLEIQYGVVLATMGCFRCDGYWTVNCPPLAVSWRGEAYSLQVDKKSLIVKKVDLSRPSNPQVKRRISGD